MSGKRPLPSPFWDLLNREESPKRAKLSGDSPNSWLDRPESSQNSVPIIDLTGDDSDNSDDLIELKPRVSQYEALPDYGETSLFVPEYRSRETESQGQSPIEATPTPNGDVDSNEPTREEISPGVEAGDYEYFHGDEQVAYDVCFGVLCIEATSPGGIKLPLQCTRASLKCLGNAFWVYIEGVSTRAAIISSDQLAHLVEKFSVTLTATICGKKATPVRVPGSEDKKTRLGPKRCSVRIVVYGIQAQKEEFAEALSERDLFLQHPSEAEFNREVKYFNPQYLLAPGEDMPPLDKLKISRCCVNRESTSGAQALLGEVERSEILKIFDTAFDPDEKPMESFKQSPRISTQLKRHQLEAAAMMAEKETTVNNFTKLPVPLGSGEASEEQNNDPQLAAKELLYAGGQPLRGGILADEMGLGKTLSALALVCHSLDAIDTTTEAPKEPRPRATLIVAPKSAIHSWEKQIATHIVRGGIQWSIYHGLRRREMANALASCDIVLTTYETLRFDIDKGPISDRKWARIILDEAHKIRNPLSKTFEAVCRISAINCWCLTGTPIQNSLDDYGSLLAFTSLWPEMFKDKFHRVITAPVKQKKPEGLPRLRAVVAATCLRRTKANYAAALGLTQKSQQVEFVELTSSERNMYEFFKRRSYLIADFENRPKPGAGKKSKSKTEKKERNRRSTILVLIGLLRLICNHGEALIPKSALKAWKSRDDRITWEILESGVRKCDSCGCETEESDTFEYTAEELPCGHYICSKCSSKSQSSTNFSSCRRCGKPLSPAASPNPSQALTPPRSQARSPAPSPGFSPLPSQTLSPMSSQTKSPFAPQIGFGVLSRARYPPSSKVKALVENITRANDVASFEPGAPPHKCVVFSYWTKMLDIIETALVDEGLSCRRIDGQSSLPQRKEAIDKFNSDPMSNVMLASIGAAGEGIDLTAANTVHIVEPHWNPMAEAQAVDRVHRIGQKQDVTVVRYIVNQSIEEYVQWIQMDKLRLIKRSWSADEAEEENIEAARWQKLEKFLQSEELRERSTRPY